MCHCGDQNQDWIVSGETKKESTCFQLWNIPELSPRKSIQFINYYIYVCPDSEESLKKETN